MQYHTEQFTMSNIFHYLQEVHEIPKLPFVISAIISLLFFSFLIRKWMIKPVGSHVNIPPSPRKLPILGNLHQLSSLPHHDLQSMAKKHGPWMLLHFGSTPTLVASSADAAREIMKTHDHAFSDRYDSSVYRRLLYDLKDVAAAPYGEYWRQLKSICVLQLLSNRRVQSCQLIRTEEAANLMERIRQSATLVNLSELFAEKANDVVCRSAFGKKYREGETGKKFIKLLKELMELLGCIVVGDFVPCLRWIDLVNGFDAKVNRVAKELDNFMEGVIREHMENPTEQAVKDRHGENFLDILLDLYHNKTSGVSIERDSVKALIIDMFAGGTDTTATVLEWAMAELLRHPRIMKKLQSEVRGIVKHGMEITNDDLEKMHYLKAVRKETLRCHTPLPLLAPRSTRKDVKVQGYDIAAGTVAIINVWAICRDPAYWDEPEEFKPERFLNSSIDFKGLDFEFLPFGSGRRGCPGIQFAMATDELILANVVHKFDWKLPDGLDGKELDMTKRPGLSIHRAVPLQAVATECYY